MANDISFPILVSQQHLSYTPCFPFSVLPTWLMIFPNTCWSTTPHLHALFSVFCTSHMANDISFPILVSQQHLSYTPCFPFSVLPTWLMIFPNTCWSTTPHLHPLFSVFCTSHMAHGVSFPTLLKIGCYCNTFRGVRLNVPVWLPRGVTMGC